MAEILDYDQMLQTASEWSGIQQMDELASAGELLEALGIPLLLSHLELAEQVIVAADSFHPVARFFAEGSPERCYILEVLRRTPH